MSPRRLTSAALALVTVAATVTGGVDKQVASADPQQLSSDMSSNVPEDWPIGIPQIMSSGTGTYSGPLITEHEGAPTPVPFNESYLAGYISDLSSYEYGIYYDVVDGFNDIRANHHWTLLENMKIVVDKNNNATPERIKMAQKDAMADQQGVVYATADALGPEAAKALRDALDENRLPKTTFLLGNGYAARAGGLASATFIEKKIFDYERPFVQAPDKIKRYQVGERDLYGTSPAYPSGHTNQATWITTLLATMLPEMGPQILYRGAQSGESRLVMGVHFPLDVTAGRMMGNAAAADRLNDPKMNDAVDQAAKELRAELEWRTGKSIEELAAQAKATTSDAAAVEGYTDLLDYGFKPIYDTNAEMIVPKAAPVLLESRFPELSYEQRAEVLRQTAYQAGQPLDDQSAAGSWQRLNLAAAWTAEVTVNADGSVSVQ